MHDAFRLGAKEAARLIERGELAAEALVASCHERVAAREPTVKAWTYLAREFPAANASPAPLFGVPVGVKDIFDTHDMPTAYGSPIYAGYRPRGDAAVVALTRRAGGTILGKTVTAEFATFVPRQTRNPLDPSRTPGGSSSGSAAAVADLMVPLAFGTQTAGSLIRPASYCGIFAFKPTYNVLPRAGLKPGADSLDTVGVYARSVEDLAFFAAALTQRTDLEAKLERPPRIGVCRTYEWERVQPEMRRALDDARRTLDADEFELPSRFRGLRESHTAILWYEVARSLADEFTRFPDNGPAFIDIVNADGSGLRRVTPRCTRRPLPDAVPAGCEDAANVSFTPDGQHLTFSRATGHVRHFPRFGWDQIEHSAIAIIGVDGSGQREILRLPRYRGDANFPQMSPDGRYIVFERDNSPLSKPRLGIALFVMNADGSGLHRVTPWNLRGGDNPDWAPDSSRILFHSGVAVR